MKMKLRTFCSAVIMLIEILGIVLLIVNRKKIVIENNAPVLLESDKRDIVRQAPGIVAAATALIILTVLSLFN